MAYSKMGFGGVLLVILLVGLKVFNAYHRHTRNNPPPPSQDVEQFDSNAFAQAQQERIQQNMERARQQTDSILQQSRQQTQAAFESRQRAAEQRYQEQLERNRQQQAEMRERFQQATQLPAYTPPRVVTTPPSQTTRQPQAQPQPQRQPATRPTPQPSPQPVVPEVPEIEPFAFSPRPDDALLEKYPAWETDDAYARFLGEVYTFGDWQFKPSREFNLQRSNTRTVKWGAGKAGVGLDADLFKLYPRDHGMACPVHEDTESRQVFRLGRREVRAKGNAEVGHMESNGLCIWRIHTPPREGDRTGSCYYLAVVGEQDAILFTARYDATKPEQIAAFDAVVQTLEYHPK